MQYPAQLLCVGQGGGGRGAAACAGEEEEGGALLEKFDPAKGPLKEYRMRRMNGAE